MNDEGVPLRPARTRVTRAGVVGVVASVIRFAGAFCALILVSHVLLTVGEADPAHAVTEFVRRCADALALGFQHLFMLADLKTRVLVNFGLAAAFWLAVSRALGRLVLSLA